MSVTRSRLIGEIFSYCTEPDGRPIAGKVLPQENLVFQILTESEAEMLRDLDLSPQNRRVSKYEIQLSENQLEYSISSTDFGAPAYAALQVDTASDFWMPVDIVNADSVLNAARDGRLAISFRDTPSVIETSWQPTSNHTLRLWYDRGGSDDPTLGEATEIGNLYDSYLKLRTIAQCRELMELPIGEVLTTRLASSERQWQRYVKMSRQQGTTAKTRVYTPPRFRRAWPFVDRTRFFIP